MLTYTYLLDTSRDAITNISFQNYRSFQFLLSKSIFRDLPFFITETFLDFSPFGNLSNGWITINTYFNIYHFEIQEFNLFVKTHNCKETILC